MQTEFNNNERADRFIDEALIDYLFDDEVVDMFYDEDVIGNFNVGVIDFGGGVKGITCRSVLAACNKDPKQLLKILGLKRNNQNRAMCGQIIKECMGQVSSAAYLL